MNRLEANGQEAVESTAERFAFRFQGLDVEIEIDRGHRNFIALARTDGRRIGVLTAIWRGDDTMLLGNVEVEDAFAAKNTWILRLLRRKWPKLGIKSFRGRGIGTALLIAFLDHCRDHGIREIYGSVMQEGLNENRSLLRWYQDHGFQVRTPDERCLPNAVSMVVWTALP